MVRALGSSDARKRAIDERVGDAEIMARVEDRGERGIVEDRAKLRLVADGVAQMPALRCRALAHCADERVRRVAAERGRRRHLHGLGEDLPARHVEIRAHFRRIDVELRDDARHRVKRAGGEHADFVQRSYLAGQLPSPRSCSKMAASIVATRLGTAPRRRRHCGTHGRSCSAASTSCRGGCRRLERLGHLSLRVARRRAQLPSVATMRPSVVATSQMFVALRVPRRVRDVEPKVRRRAASMSMPRALSDASVPAPPNCSTAMRGRSVADTLAMAVDRASTGRAESQRHRQRLLHPGAPHHRRRAVRTHPASPGRRTAGDAVVDQCASRSCTPDLPIASGWLRPSEHSRASDRSRRRAA
jgi:hypothetical protein